MSDETTTTTTTTTTLKYGQQAIADNQLEAWPNPRRERDYVIHFEIPATIVIDFVPDEHIVELKSLKLYINGFRDRAVSHEAATNDILDDLVRVLRPRWMRVVGEFNVRGNIKTTVFAEHAHEGYTGARPEYRRPTFSGI